MTPSSVATVLQNERSIQVERKREKRRWVWEHFGKFQPGLGPPFPAGHHGWPTTVLPREPTCVAFGPRVRALDPGERPCPDVAPSPPPGAERGSPTALTSSAPAGRSWCCGYLPSDCSVPRGHDAPAL